MSGSPVIVTCEHASNRVPKDLGTLGLRPSVLETHVAWDPGAAEVATATARRIGCPVRLGRWSRLVADLNRNPPHGDVVRRVAWGIPVPGNRGLSEEELKHRVARFHRPWRDDVEALVRAAIARHGRCIHLSVHSFTPVLRGVVRPTDIGLLHDPALASERRIVELVLRELEGSPWTIHRNRPYRGTSDSLPVRLRRLHGARRYVALEVEISQRLVSPPEAWARLRRDVVGAVARAVAAFEGTGRAAGRRTTGRP